jgi:hypothetical protein
LSEGEAERERESAGGLARRVGDCCGFGIVGVGVGFVEIGIGLLSSFLSLFPFSSFVLSSFLSFWVDADLHRDCIGLGIVVGTFGLEGLLIDGIAGRAVGLVVRGL